MGTQTITGFSEFLAQLRDLDGDPRAACSLAQSYIATHPDGFPVIEGNTAHFLYRAAPGATVGVGGDWNGLDWRRGLMAPVGGEFVHYAHDFEPDARVDYLFFEAAEGPHNGSANDGAADSGLVRTFQDQLNPHTSHSGLGARSELAMPAYRRPEITQKRRGIREGSLVEGTIYSAALGEERPYTVYLPGGYNSTREPYPCIYFHDGGDYLRMGEAVTTLDNLIGTSEMPPVVAVFVSPLAREHEYNCDPAYLEFFTDELVPEMQRGYNLCEEAWCRAIMGPSLGGLISLYIGAMRPDVFGLVGAQSSVIATPGGNEPFDARRAFAVDPPLPLKLHLVIGTYEECFAVDRAGRCRDLLSPVRQFSQLLERHHYEYRYVEHHQGHAWGLWRDCLADALLYFFAEG